MSRIGQERIDWPTRCRSPEPIDAIRRRDIGFNHGDAGAQTTETVSGGLDLRSIGGHQQIEAFLRTNRGQFESDARRGPCDDREWFAHRSSSSSMSTGTART